MKKYDSLKIYKRSELKEPTGFQRFIHGPGMFIFFLSLFVSLLLATAGIVLFPKISKISSSLVCPQSDLQIESKYYSYKPGQKGVSRSFYCVDAENKKISVDSKVIVSTFFISFVSLFGIGILLLWLRRFF